jgi:hypothetical protein
MRRGESARRAARIRLLSDQLDHLRSSAVERTRSIDTKASFVVVAAGVIATTTFAGLDDSRTWLWGLVPLTFTIATVVAAAIALWPVKIESPSGRKMVSLWVDEDGLAPDVLEDRILEVKTVEVEYRDEKNETKGLATKFAFFFLILSLCSALAFTVADAAITNGNSNGKTTPTPAATPTETAAR